MTRKQSLEALEDALDSDFFKALMEPVRVGILRSLIANGSQSINDLAEPFSQERTVIGRHVRILAQAELVRVERVGRHGIVHLEPANFIHRFETILARARRCIAVCCPEALE